MANKGGRPVAEIDWEKLDTLIGIQCTAVEVSAYLGLSERTIERAIKRTHKMSLVEYFKQKAKAGHISIRRALYKKAVNGDTTALIFWYKAHLNFTDAIKVKQETKTDKQMAEQAKEFVTKIESLVTELKAQQPVVEDKEKKMGLLAASLGITG